MFSTYLCTNFNFWVVINLSSANALNLGQSKILLFGKVLTLYHRIRSFTNPRRKRDLENIKVEGCRTSEIDLWPTQIKPSNGTSTHEGEESCQILKSIHLGIVVKPLNPDAYAHTHIHQSALVTTVSLTASGLLKKNLMLITSIFNFSYNVFNPFREKL